MTSHMWQAKTLGDWLEQAAVLRLMVQLGEKPGDSAISPAALRDLIFATWPERLLAPVHTLELREMGKTDVRCVVHLLRVFGNGGEPPHAHVDERVLRDSYYYVRPVDELDEPETDDEREAREDSYRLEDSKGRRYSLLDAYQGVVAGFRALARPGVTLSAEQLAYIQRLRDQPPSWPQNRRDRRRAERGRA